MSDLSLSVGRPDASVRVRGARFERMFQSACAAAATALLGAMVGLCILLAWGGWPSISTFGLGFLTSTMWNPVTDVYGGEGPIVGTLITSAIALGLAVPLAFLTAVFLVEFCPVPLRRPIGIAVELLAGIPSIVYGMWGLFVFAPIFAQYVEEPLASSNAPETIWERLFSGIPNGTGILTASVILAIMILPYIAATLRELFLSIPVRVRESAYGMGCTALEVVWSVSFRYVRKSAVGAVMLGLGRALGETMAVTFVIGNSHRLPHGLFDSGATISSVIANEFAEATSPMHTSALLELGFILFIITFIVLASARALLGHGHSA